MLSIEYCLLSSHISDYPGISQGKTRIQGVNDGEEFEVTDVSAKYKIIFQSRYRFCIYYTHYINL